MVVTDNKKLHSAHLLALAGTIPFVAGTAGLWVLPRNYAMELIYPLVAYGSVILAFMGAVHWGLAIALENAGDSHRATRQFWLSVSSPLVAWLALMLEREIAMIVLAFAFAGVYAIDWDAVKRGFAPSWYQRLRLPISVFVIALLLASVVATRVRLA
ncbi:MAG: hypothetical protein ACI915_003494 [Gammaproteobacteria bacterium]